MKRTKTMAETGNSTGASVGARFWFTIAVWVACAVRGKLGRANYYITQAQKENGIDYYGKAFKEGLSPWCMHPSLYTKRRSGKVTVGSEDIARYSGWYGWAFFKATLDRIAWDDAQVPDEALTFNQWAEAVAFHGFAGGANATSQQRAAYRESLIDIWEQKAMVFRALSDDNPTGQIVSRVMFWFVVLGVFTLIAYLLLWLLYRRQNRKR